MKFHFYRIKINSKHIYRLLNCCRNNEIRDVEINKDYAGFSINYNQYSDLEKILKENKIDGESYITKIVYVDNILLGYLALCYFQWNGKNVISINPIVINPKYHNNGYGKLILNDLIKNNKKIINIDVDIFNATISITNISSIKLFESLNFTKKGNVNDGFQDYCLEKWINIF